MKLNIKILLLLSLISIVSVSIIGLVGISFGKKTIENEVYEKLTSIRELKANRIEAYFEIIRNQLLSFSENYMVVDAMTDFNRAFYADDFALGSLNLQQIDRSLQEYYLLEFLPRLNSNSDKSYLLEDFLPEDIKTRYLQYLYISNNHHKVGEKNLLSDANIDIEYNKVHKKYHPIFNSYINKFGFYDLFLVDLNGNIIYSVYKEVDFPTSLTDGALRESNFGQLFRDIIEADSPDASKMIDFQIYAPSYNGQAAFIASPIFKGDQKLGALVFQLPIDRINNIMTDNSQWEKVGLGKSGETYIVGDDFLLRNQSRFLIEDKTNYLGMLKEIGEKDETIYKIDNLNTSIGLQKVETKGTVAALEGDTGISVFDDYRGISVLSSYRPLNIEDVKWAIMSELDRKEAYSAMSDFAKTILSWLILIIVLIPVVAYFFSRSLVNPLIKLTDAAKQMAAGNLDIQTGLCRKDEIGALACSFDSMSESLKNTLGELEDTNANLEQKVLERTKEVESAHIKTKSIITNANDAIITINEKQQIIMFNPAAQSIFGYSFEEIKGQPIDILLPDKSISIHKKHMKKFRDGSQSSKVMNQRAEVKGKRKNGELFYAEVSISKQKLDSEFQFTAFLKDITERKEAEERIKISENMFRSISSSASDAIISVNQNGTIEFWNDAAEQIFGFKNDEVFGKNLDLIVPEIHIDNHHEGMARVTGGGEKKIIGKTIETQAKRKDGEIFPIELSLSNWEGKTGMNFSSIIRDITERKAMELKIEEANARMEDELNVGHEIQMSMLPLIFPAYPDHSEFNIFALLEPAREVGGDFYDFFFIDENKFLFSVADVSGKGVPSALFMAVCKTLIKSRASEDDSPSSIVTHVNEELSRENTTAMFVTLFICIIDLSTGEITYTNAGHNPPYVKRLSGEIETLNTLHGPVVGAMEDFAYGESKVKLNVNDIIVLFTDGVNEAMNSQRELFTENRIIDVLKTTKSDNVNDQVKGIYRSVMEFQGDAEQADDITILGFEYLEPLINTILYSKKLTIKNELSEIDRLNEEFELFCTEHNIPPQIYMKFNIVFDELINNIVSYAYVDDGSNEILITFNLTKDQIVVSIEDEGVAFNPFNMATPDIQADAEDREIGGLGIHIVRNIMDNVSYKRFVKKNMTTLFKNIK